MFPTDNMNEIFRVYCNIHRHYMMQIWIIEVTQFWEIYLGGCFLCHTLYTAASEIKYNPDNESRES